MDEYKEYESRVTLEMVFDVHTGGKTEEEAGANSESMIEWVARQFSKFLEANGDGVRLPTPSECWLSTWGVRNIDIAEFKEE